MTGRCLRSRHSLALLTVCSVFGAGLTGCSQLQQTLRGFGQGQTPPSTSGASPAGEPPQAPYLYTGNSTKGSSQDINACAVNARSILASNGYVDSTNESRNEEGSAVWVSGDRNDIGVSAEFQCSNNGVTVLAMSGMDNDKLFAEYDRIHDLNW